MNELKNPKRFKFPFLLEYRGPQGPSCLIWRNLHIVLGFLIVQLFDELLKLKIKWDCHKKHMSETVSYQLVLQHVKESVRKLSKVMISSNSSKKRWKFSEFWSKALSNFEKLCVKLDESPWSISKLNSWLTFSNGELYVIRLQVKLDFFRVLSKNFW